MSSCYYYVSYCSYDKGSKRLAIVTLPNQDPLQATTGLVPLLGIDVWEHAYYLQVRTLWGLPIHI